MLETDEVKIVPIDSTRDILQMVLRIAKEYSMSMFRIKILSKKGFLNTSLYSEPVKKIGYKNNLIQVSKLPI